MPLLLPLRWSVSRGGCGDRDGESGGARGGAHARAGGGRGGRGGAALASTAASAADAAAAAVLVLCVGSAVMTFVTLDTSILSRMST